MFKTINRPGYIGFKKKRIFRELNEEYGSDNWRIAWQWNNQIITQPLAIQLYEDAYYEYFKSNSSDLNWLINTASDVYDISESDIQSGLDYSIQNSNATHLQDISIRRVLLRLGKKFEGDHYVQIRGKDSEGAKYNPGFIPFHLSKKIIKPSLEGWWQENSIEDFYQSNKVLQIRIDK